MQRLDVMTIKFGIIETDVDLRRSLQKKKHSTILSSSAIKEWGYILLQLRRSLGERL